MTSKTNFLIVCGLIALCMLCVKEETLFKPENVPVVFAGRDTTISIKDTIFLHGTATDNDGSIAQWQRNINNSGWINTSSGDTVLLPSDTPAVYVCSLMVTDNDGFVSKDEVVVTVVLDAPMCSASTATPMVSINDSISLSGSARDVFGKIVKWEWDVGNTGTFVQSADSTHKAVVTSLPSSGFMCILRVTDDDGNKGYDTTSIVVVLDAPVCSATTTTPIVSINDSIALKGIATDGYGKVVKWEWDVGNNGTFVEISPDSIKIVRVPSTAQYEYICVLRVTDDDGNISTDSLSINILEYNNSMVKILAKDMRYIMGGDKSDEQPMHSVSFTYDFWMDTVEVSQWRYDSIMNKNFSGFSVPDWRYGKGKDLAAYFVTWGMAALFCNVLSKNEGRDTVYKFEKLIEDHFSTGFIEFKNLQIDYSKNGYRLPTEAEWEYACRTGRYSKYYWGDTIDGTYTWFEKNSGEQCHSVGSKKPNDFGLYDMIGNVFEWCNDWYNLYSGTIQVDPIGPNTDSNNQWIRRVYRGGYFNNMDYGSATRSYGCYYETGKYITGFRVVLPIIE